MLNLEQLNEYLKEMIQKISERIQNVELLPQFDAFFKGAKNLTEKLDYYTTPIDGALPELSEEDYNQICLILNNLVSEKQNFDLNVYRYYNNMFYYPNFAQRYWRTIRTELEPYVTMFTHFNMDEKKTLPEHYEHALKHYQNVKTVSVDKIDEVKLNTGKKIKLQILNTNNELVDGFFQIDNKFVIDMAFLELVENIGKKYPDYKEFFEGLHEKFKFQSIANELSTLVNCFDINTKKIDIGKFSELITNLNINDKFKEYCISKMTDEGFVVALYDFSRNIERLNIKYNVNVNMIGIKEYESLTQRNSAVTSVANLIGAEDVIPAAEKMVVNCEDKKFLGVFEQKAIGIEVGSIGNDDEIRDFTLEQFESPEALKAMAKLQILDFITGNVNRNKNKLFLNIDRSDPNKPKIIGIQGISNKYSFSCNEVDSTESIGNMPSLASLKVIDMETATNILSITESQLKANLIDYNMSEEAIEKAWQRTRRLQKVIANSNVFDKNKGIIQTNLDEVKKIECVDPEEALDNIKLNIVNNEDWENIKLKDLTNDKQKENNYFEMLKDVARMMKSPRELNQELQKDSFVQGFILKDEYNKTKNEIEAYYNNLVKVDKTFFKKNRMCQSVIDEIRNSFLKQNEEEFNIENDTEFVSKMDIKLIGIQSKIATAKYEITSKYKQGQKLSKQDQDRINSMDALYNFINTKMNVLNTKYGDKHETDLRIEYDIKKCNCPLRSTQLHNNIKKTLDNNQNVILESNEVDLPNLNEIQKVNVNDFQKELKNNLNKKTTNVSIVNENNVDKTLINNQPNINELKKKK